VRLVIDASVAVKWFVKEDGHNDAVAILQRRDECLSPDLMLPEVAGAFDKKIKAGTLDPRQAIEAIKALRNNITIIEGAKFIEASLGLASELQHPIADCIYMACAMEVGAKLVTADKIFLKKAANGGYRRLVVELGHELEDDLPAQSLSGEEIASIEKLANDARAVFDFVRSKTGQPFGQLGLKIHNSADLRPAFDSPNYARLVSHIDQLSASKRHELIALCWLGRGFDGENWTALIEHAQSLDPRDQSDTAYIISKLSHVSDGVERLKTLAQTATKS